MNKELLVFGSEWCQGCKSLKKMLSSNGILYTEIDIDKEPEKAQEFGVRGLPTSIIIEVVSGFPDSPGSVQIDKFVGSDKIKEIIKGME